MKVLDAAVRQLQGISQVGGGLIPGLTQLCGGDLERIRPKTVELLGECHQGRITVAAHLFEDRFSGGGRILLGCSSGASGDEVELLFRFGCVVKTPGQSGLDWI